MAACGSSDDHSGEDSPADVDADRADLDGAVAPLDAAPADAPAPDADSPDAATIDAAQADAGGATLPTGLPQVTWEGQPWAVDTSGENGGFPLFAGGEVTLTPNMNDRGSVIIYERAVVPPFTVNFEYQITDTDGCAQPACQYNSADGIAFFFAKDTSRYLVESPPTGGGRGVIADGTGVTLSFEIYAGNKLTLRGPTGTSLTSVATVVYTGDTWRQGKIIVTASTLLLFLDGSMTPTLSYTSPTAWDTTFQWLGFGGGTGGAAAEQKLRAVKVID
jgi:hypothetical protein